MLSWLTLGRFDSLAIVFTARLHFVRIARNAERCTS